MADELANDDGNAEGFGDCCEELADAIEGAVMEHGELEPLITVGEDGILYFSVFVTTLEDDGAGTVDHPLFFCPFCGTPTQNKAAVMETLRAQEEGSPPLN